MKKVLSLILALVMAFSCGKVAFAAGYTSDGAYLTKEGYIVFNNAIKPAVQKVLKES